MQQLWAMKEVLMLFLFLGIETIEDLRYRSIRMDWVILFLIAGILMQWIEPEESLLSVLAGCGIGMLLILISYFPGIGLGSGDGWIFVVTGIFLGGIKNALLCYLSFVLAAVIGSLGIMISKRWGNKKNHTLPFLPFIFLGNLFICIAE